MVFNIQNISHNLGQKFSPFAQLTLRVGIALVFIWFSIRQFFDPYNYIGYLPDFLFFSEYAVQIIYANATFELIGAILLILGYYHRIVGFLFAVHLLFILPELGWTDTLARDVGLLFASLAIAFSDDTRYTIERKLAQKKTGAKYTKD